MKRFLSALLAFVMVAALCVPALAEDLSADQISEQNRLKQVLTDVKTVLDIPEEYSEFDYYFNNRQNVENWTLMWTVPESGDRISVSADGQGRISSYNSYISSESNRLTAPKIRKADAQKTAYDFAESLHPGIMQQVVLDDSSVGKYFGTNSYQFYYRRVVNGLPYDNYVQVEVSFATGRVKSCYFNWDFDLEFESPDGVIEASQAVDKWKDGAQMQLNYQIFAEYKDGGYVTTAKLLYNYVGSTDPILAKSGEYLEQNYIWQSNDKDMAGDSAVNESAAARPSSGVDFTENELKRMAELDKYITVQQADAKVREFEELNLDSSYKLTSNSMGYNYAPYTNSENRSVVWNLSYSAPVVENDFNPKRAYATVDAVTGELLSFNSYNYYDFGWNDVNADGILDDRDEFKMPDNIIDLDAAQQLADGFLKKVSSAKYENLMLDYSAYSDGIAVPYAISGKYDDVINTGAYFDYTRSHNGIPVRGNGAYVRVDCVAGKISYYSVSWTENLAFEAEEAALDAQTALDNYFENTDVVLKYVPFTVYLYDIEAQEAQEGTQPSYGYYYGDIPSRLESRLVYALDIPFYAISAVTGKPLDYSGNEYEPQATVDFNGFDDIDGHWAQSQIELLSDIGVILPSDSFNPDDIITQKEFIAMLMAVTNSYIEIPCYDVIDEYVDGLIAQMQRSLYYIPENDPEIAPDQPLNRKEAVKFIVRALGYEKIATMGDIFKTNFADNDAIPKDYLGYAAIASAMGVITGSDGYFNGDDSITRAESAVLIYNYMNSER